MASDDAIAWSMTSLLELRCLAAAAASRRATCSRSSSSRAPSIVNGSTSLPASHYVVVVVQEKPATTTQTTKPTLSRAVLLTRNRTLRTNTARNSCCVSPIVVGAASCNESNAANVDVSELPYF